MYFCKAVPLYPIIMSRINCSSLSSDSDPQEHSCARVETRFPSRWRLPCAIYGASWRCTLQRSHWTGYGSGHKSHEQIYSFVDGLVVEKLHNFLWFNCFMSNNTTSEHFLQPPEFRWFLLFVLVDYFSSGKPLCGFRFCHRLVDCSPKTGSCRSRIRTSPHISFFYGLLSESYELTICVWSPINGTATIKVKVGETSRLGEVLVSFHRLRANADGCVDSLSYWCWRCRSEAGLQILRSPTFLGLCLFAYEQSGWLTMKTRWIQQRFSGLE